MDRQATRSAVYHRLYWLWPILAVRSVRLGLRLAAWGAVVGFFLFCFLILGLRYAVLPRVGDYQADIERIASQAIGQHVKIGRIDAGWAGLNPELTLNDVRIADAQGRPAFALTRVDSVLSWHSLWRLRPTLALLALEGPVLHVRRDEAGRITVAGVDMEGETDPRVIEWVLEQPHIRIRDAIVVWEDGQRKAPPLLLEDLQFGLDNSGKHHRFGFSAAPPAALASRIDLRGDLKGDLAAGLNEVSGEAYLELDYADLAGWRAWADYPVDLAQGRGAVRLWASWKDAEVRATADLALEGVRGRLAPDLPELELTEMRGRLAGRYGPGRWEAEGHKIELTTTDGIRVAPTDFHVDWREDAKRQRLQGSASATMVEVGALQRLAGYLPLDAGSRDLLAKHRPEGRLFDLRANWDGGRDRLDRYSLKARFDGLGILAAGYFPGAGGLSGEVDASEKGGTLVIDSRNASLDLPAVFVEPMQTFAELRGKASWKKNDGVLDARLERLEFSGHDAAGNASGTYRFAGEGPGVIDLTAAITRADGTAVWRYMPRVVNDDTRNWLRHSIVAGHASDARLSLRGDLRNFPFRDKATGEFLITAKAHDVRLDYADGWPPITGIEADMSFGAGMKIAARSGHILGTTVGPVTAEIPDFEMTDETLLIKGIVSGPTGEFLKFIDQSPVGDKIDRFTEDMRATGNGRLDLQFDMPLRHVADTRVRGEYQFQNNVVTVVPGLPPVSQVNGRLQVTENSIVAPEITGNALGGPMRLTIRNEADRVNVAMSGTANVKEARKIIDTPLFDYVTGTTAWKGEVRARKKVADFIIDTNLTGVSSSLPEPFNKSAGTAVPLRIEKGGVPDQLPGAPPQERLRVTLGKAVEAQFLRREQGDAMVIERGAVGVGEAAPRMPDKGVAVVISQPRIDADLWRQLFAGSDRTGGAAKSDSPLPLATVTVRTPQLRLFGRDYQAVELGVAPRDGGWQVAVNTREAQGDIFWQGAGAGWLQADLKRLVLSAASGGGGDDTTLTESLPGMDVRVADFIVGERRLGRLEVKAQNDRGTWNLDGVVLQNSDGVLKGTGQWKHAGPQRTRLNFELAATDLGKLLDRLGYAGTVKRGTANLKGEVDWNGAPTDIDYASLTGKLEVLAEKGQFAKIEPGLGKLLGLISLQSLPRRLSLDFRDIFSEGFAFDTIDGKLKLKGGVMRTDGNLRIDGPAARVLMKGEADLKQETQDVMVTVQPEVGTTLTVGTALLLASPVAAAAAAIANKVLQNPLNKIFSFQYHVSGSWNDPKVEKVGHNVQDVPGAAGSPVTPESKP